MKKSEKLEFLSLVRGDLMRLAPPDVRSFLKWYFLPRGSSFPYQVWLRLIHCLRAGGIVAKCLAFLIYPLYRHFEFKYGIHANPNIEIGGGLYVVHGGGVHLNCKRIGKNLTIYQGVTLGIQEGERPIVEDDVTIYPNAVVVGGLRLGKGCTVGALSYVSHDVLAGATVVGAPAHAVESKL